MTQMDNVTRTTQTPSIRRVTARDSQVVEGLCDLALPAGGCAWIA